MCGLWYESCSTYGVETFCNICSFSYGSMILLDTATFDMLVECKTYVGELFKGGLIDLDLIA